MKPQAHLIVLMYCYMKPQAHLIVLMYF